MTFYKEAIVFLAAMTAALALYLFLRLLVDRTLSRRGRASGHFLARLILPVVLLAAVLVFKLDLFRRAFGFTRRFELFVDAALLFFAGFLVVRVVNSAVLSWYARRRRPFPLPRVLHGLLLAVLYLVILFSVLRNIMGINITPFLTTSAILTMIIGLALQGVLSNVLSGMSLHFTKSFQRGDWVRIADQEGMVVDTTWRETRLLDRNSNIVIVPNTVMASERVTNFSLPDKKTALTVTIRAAFDVPPADVEEALLEAARDMPEALPAPQPLVLVRGHDDFGISYTLKFWVSDFSRKDAVLSGVGRLAWHKLRRRGVSIPVPVRESLEALGGALSAGRRAGIVPGRDQDNFRDLFRSTFLRVQEGRGKSRLLVPAGEVRALAGRVRRERYSAGEVLFRQGDRGEACYIVARGLVRGEVVSEDKGKRYVSEFRTGPGGLVGEMSLFTGLPRTATCSLERDSELIVVTAADFATLLGKNPRLAESIARIVSERNRKNQERLAKIKELSAQDVKASCSRKSILAHLKNFVHLFLS